MMKSDFTKEFPNLDEETIIKILMMLKSFEDKDGDIKSLISKLNTKKAIDIDD